MNNDEFENITHYIHEKIISYINANIDKEFTCFLRINHNKNRKHCRGGVYKKGPGIDIASYPIRHSLKWNIFMEYDSFVNTDYGSFTCKNNKYVIYAIVAHEISHAYTMRQRNIKPHGKEFREFYSMLRKVFINDYVTNIGIDNKQLNKLINSGEL